MYNLNKDDSKRFSKQRNVSGTRMPIYIKMPHNSTIFITCFMRGTKTESLKNRNKQKTRQ